MQHDETDPLADLVEPISLAGRRFELREMSRRDNRQLVKLLQESVQRLATENEELQQKVESGELSAEDALDEALNTDWKCLDKGLCFILRHPLDGQPAPDEAWARDNLNRRKALALIEKQEKLNGVDRIKKKLETAMLESLEPPTSSASETELGGLSTIVSLTATE